MMTAEPENFGPDLNNPDVLEVKCSKCLREINIEQEYVEIFVEKFYASMDEWLALHRHCYESSIEALLNTLDR